MKNFFKKFKKIFVFLLIIPVMFAFSACGKKSKNDTDEKPSGGIEQPLPSGPQDPDDGDDDGGDVDPEPEPEVQVENFSVELNYDLPTYIADLLPKETKTAKVEDGYVLPTFAGTEFETYFDGWYDAENQKIDAETITGTKDETVSVFAKWKETEISNYFYTDGLEFEINDESDTASIKSYSGSSEIVVIPQFYVFHDARYNVNSVATEAFKDNMVVKDVRSCLTDYYVDSSAFENSSLEKIEFSKITVVGNSAFKNTKVKSVKFNYLSAVSESAFEDCSELESVDFSDVSGQMLKTLPRKIFYGCSNLSEVYLSLSTTAIGVSAFEGCSNLDDISFIKNTVTSLSFRAFALCTKLDKIEIPEQIVSYGTDVFEGCNISEMTTYLYFDSNYEGGGIGFTLFQGNLAASLKKIVITGAYNNTIPENYFKNYYMLTDIVMDNSITSIENNAFKGCTALANVTLSTALEGDNINLAAFKDSVWYANLDNYLQDNSMTELVHGNTLVYISSIAQDNYEVADGIKYIGKNVFTAKTGITSVSIPASVEYINVKAFEGSSIESITVDADNKNYACLTGSFEINNSGSGVNDVNTGTYYSLFQLDSSGNKVTLIAYAADLSGGTFVVPNTVTFVYDIAFDLTHAPEYVYVYSDSAQVKLNQDSNVSYVFANDNINTENTSSLVIIYKYLSEDKYTLSFDEFDALKTDYASFGFNSDDYYNLIIVTEADDFGGDITTYYLVDHLLQMVTSFEVVI